MIVPLKAALRKNRLRMTDGQAARHPQRAGRQQPWGDDEQPDDAEDRRAGLPGEQPDLVVGAELEQTRGEGHQHARAGGPAVRGALGRSRSRCPPVREIARRWLTIMARVTSAGGTTTQNTSRHVKAVVSQPDSGAPIREGSTHAADTHANTVGRSAVG